MPLVIVMGETDAETAAVMMKLQARAASGLAVVDNFLETPPFHLDLY
jgi:hypothetical protein